MRVELYNIEAGKEGNAYTLRCGNEYVRCDDVLIMETEDGWLEETFAEWQELAEAGEEGYAHWVA